MRLCELYLVETTEEDRALISLSSSIYSKLQKYADVEPEPSRSYNDTDDDFDEYDVDFEPDDESPVTVGKIGDMFDTPIDVLNNITIELRSPESMRMLASETSADNISKGPNRGDIFGMWIPNLSTIFLNKDYITSNQIQSTITHELRHALDDYKSNFQANKDDGRYSRPKKKEHRKAGNDPYMGNLAYAAQPAEINARFVQVLNAMVPVIKRAVKLDPGKTEAYVMKEFRRALEHFRITDLFPEKEKSKDYKRLMKRGVDFINKEMNFAKSASF